ncbi:hypothetical protein HY633_01550 [Candidatus Uhrbacteria bacterium]|nr:hypothetical protein [Candidatus Uhrbacteria bacterium]
MIEIRDEGVILEKSDLPFENQAVLNPACIEVDGVTHMFYRAVRRGDMVSTIGYCQLVDNKVIKRSAEPVIRPEFDYEKGGVEDPRIVLLDGTYYLFYTAFDEKNALIAYATSTDLKKFTKQGTISTKITYDEAEDLFRQSRVRDKYSFYEAYFKDIAGKDVMLWEKDAFIFPRKFNGKFALVHRILPGIQILFFDDFKDLNDAFWRNYLKELNRYILLDSEFKFENRNIGGGCPPVWTKDGWLLIYHAVEDRPRGKVYHAAAALLDPEDPLKVIGRLPQPLFSPTSEEERLGDVNNVVFPTSAIVKDGRLFIYYGAADSRIMCKSVDLEELVGELKHYALVHKPFSTDSFQTKVTKPWGEEIIYTPRELARTGKILTVKAGRKLSLQYHDQKEETLCLLSGKALLWLENDAGAIEKIPMVPFQGYTVVQRQKHRLEGVEDAMIIEVSSPERGTTVRIDDEYGRPNETEEMRVRKNRGWDGDGGAKGAAASKKTSKQ